MSNINKISPTREQTSGEVNRLAKYIESLPSNMRMIVGAILLGISTPVAAQAFDPSEYTDGQTLVDPGTEADQEATAETEAQPSTEEAPSAATEAAAPATEAASAATDIAVDVEPSPASVEMPKEVSEAVDNLLRYRNGRYALHAYLTSIFSAERGKKIQDDILPNQKVQDVPILKLFVKGFGDALKGLDQFAGDSKGIVKDLEEIAGCEAASGYKNLYPAADCDDVVVAALTQRVQNEVPNYKERENALKQWLASFDAIPVPGEYYASEDPALLTLPESLRMALALSVFWSEAPEEVKQQYATEVIESVRTVTNTVTGPTEHRVPFTTGLSVAQVIGGNLNNAGATLIRAEGNVYPHKNIAVSARAGVIRSLGYSDEFLQAPEASSEFVFSVAAMPRVCLGEAKNVCLNGDVEGFLAPNPGFSTGGGLSWSPTDRLSIFTRHGYINLPTGANGGSPVYQPTEPESLRLKGYTGTIGAEFELSKKKDR